MMVRPRLATAGRLLIITIVALGALTFATEAQATTTYVSRSSATIYGTTCTVSHYLSISTDRTSVSGWTDSRCAASKSHSINSQLHRDGLTEVKTLDRFCFSTTFRSGPRGTMVNRSTTNQYCQSGSVFYN